MKQFLFFSVIITLLSLPLLAQTNPFTIEQNNNGSITISFQPVEEAVSYRIYHGPTRLTATHYLATVHHPITTFTHQHPNSDRFSNYYRIVPLNAHGQTIVHIDWSLYRAVRTPSTMVVNRWLGDGDPSPLFRDAYAFGFLYNTPRAGGVPSVQYEILRQDELDGDFLPISRTDQPSFSDAVVGFDFFNNNYRIALLDAESNAIYDNAGRRMYVAQGALEINFEQLISFGIQLFGKNMLFYNARYDDTELIKREINRIHDQQMFSAPNGPAHGQFSIRRYALNFKAGSYEIDPARSRMGIMDGDEIRIGYFTSIQGLGRLPTDTRLFGSITTPAPLARGTNYDGNATCTFWRSIENLEVNPVNEYSVFRWGVSQAAPARRLNVNMNTRLDYQGEFGFTQAWASGGFVADTRFMGSVIANIQQQYYNRNNHFNHSAFAFNNWNLMSQGVTGYTEPSNWDTGGHFTTVDYTPLVREKPFLYFHEGEFRVFVPAFRKNSRGVSWNDEIGCMGEGHSLLLEKDFYVALPGTSAAIINQQLENGLNIFFAPGWFKLEEPIVVRNPNTILLGTGFATLYPSPENRAGAIFVDDVPGVIIAGVLLEALYDSDYLLKMGDYKANKDHSHNPSILHDVIIRVGGFYETPVNATISVLINSNNVIGDHLWVWRGDHGSGIGWDINRGDWGVIVAGDDVIMYGLFVEHFQKYELLWLGERGRVFFFQNESPYDPPSQEAYMSHNGTVQGWASYKVANWVHYHEAIALGFYGVFNRTGPDRRQSAQVFLHNAIEVPHRPNVWIRHVIITELSDTPNIANPHRQVNGTRNIINGTGQGVSNLQPAVARRLYSFNNGIAVLPPGHPGRPHPDCPLSHDVLTIGVEPADEDFSILLLPIVRPRWIDLK